MIIKMIKMIIRMIIKIINLILSKKINDLKYK